jgi:hypothetical protein
MRRAAPSWVLVLVACGCAGGVGADRPDWPPPATLSGAEPDASRVEDDGSSQDIDTDTDGAAGDGSTSSGAMLETTSDALGTSGDDAADAGAVPPDLGVPALDTGASGDGAMPPACASGSGACASCAELACCASIEAASTDAEAICVSTCMLDGASLPACGSQCATVDPFAEPGITDLFVCLSGECADVCGSG